MSILNVLYILLSFSLYAYIWFYLRLHLILLWLLHVTEEWRRLYNDELNDLYSSPNIVRVIKSRRMRWAGNVVRMGEERGAYRVFVGKPEERDHWGDLGVFGWIILGWISRRWDVGIWTGLGWHRIGTDGGRL